jgi:glycosyltransferase involved in cell wall biosynthesis
MARGMPCLATRVGGIPELLHDEDLIAPGDSSALCTALIALAGDPARQLRSAARNLERARAYAEDRLQEQRNRFFRAVAEATSAWQRGLVDDR